MCRQTSLLQQLHGLDLQGLRQGLEGVDARGILLALDHADIIAIEPGQVRQLLLREPAFPAQSFEIPRQDPPQSHELQRSPSL